MSHFEQLKVWEKAVDLSVRVYKITGDEAFKKRLLFTGSDEKIISKHFKQYFGRR